MGKTKRDIKNTNIANSDDDTSTGTGSLLGKFREKLYIIRKDMMFRRQKNNEEQNDYIKDKVKEIREEIYPNGRIVNNKKLIKRTKYKKGISINNQVKEKNKSMNNNKEQDNNNEKIIVKNYRTINDKDKYVQEVNNIIEKSNNYNKKVVIDNEENAVINKETVDKYKGQSIINSKSKPSDDDRDKEKKSLKVTIVKRIKGDFSKKLAELELLESELYRLNVASEESLELGKIEDLKKEIEIIVAKINKIIKEYNIYSNSYDLDDITYIDNEFLIDDILKYKRLIDSYADNKKLVLDYKLLNEFHKLYEKLDRVKSLSDEVIAKNQLKIDYLEEKNNNNEYANDRIKDLDNVMHRCDLEINNQNNYLKELMPTIDIIDKKEYTHLKFNSLNKLINSSILFLSTISLSKKMPIIPRIFINTLAVNHLVKNIYKSMIPDKVTEIEYSAINYDKELSDKINDLGYTSYLVSDTLVTISNIKEQFLIQYNESIPGFADTLIKIEKIEDKVINSQYKLDIIKNKLSRSRKQNQEKMLKLENLKKNS
ncbi:MAG: hypothetical protein IKF19_05040 [Bacilli bacterium]|nr:hypothetical protein [Bacilli bacterium]